MSKTENINKFNDFVRLLNEGTEEFATNKKELIMKLIELIEVYEDLTNDVSPKHWRSTGGHITALKRMIPEVERLTSITKEEEETYDFKV